MSRMRFLISACLFLFLGCAGKSPQIPPYVWLADSIALPADAIALLPDAIALPVGAQIVAPGVPVPHVIVVSIVDRLGTIPFAFEPANFTAQRGDTLRFVQASATMHNVRFKTQPKGAKLGAAAISPYLTNKGQTYTIVVDSRFVEGKYELVCDPHVATGTHGFLTVRGVSTN